MWSVYVIQSLKSGIFYTGMALDVANRVEEHNSGKSKFTKGHLPWKLVYSEPVGNAEAARKREKYLKSAAGKKHLKKYLGGGSLPD